MTQTANAQSVTARSEVEESFVGDTFLIQVSVDNASTATAPTPPQTPDCQIQMVNQPPSQNSQTFFDGRKTIRRQTLTYRFEVQPHKVGLLVIPPFEVNDGGRLLRSLPVRVRVKKPSTTPYLICNVTCKAGDRIYVGQKVDVTLDILVRKYRQGDVELDVNSSWGLLDRSRSSLGVFGADNPRWGETSRRDESGEKVGYWVYKLDAAAYPSKPGPLDLGQLVVAYRYPVQLGRDIFGRLQLENERRLQLQPTMPNVMVRALPLEGRPPDFNGAVGAYSMTAQAKPATVPVGDPITLTLTIRGAGPLDRLSPPRLGQVEALTRDFEVSAETPAGELSGGAKLFTQTIRPLREDVSQIPPLPMSYFNPEGGAYETAYSEAIVLKVLPAQRLALPNAAGGVAAAQGVLTPLEETSDGLLANETNARVVLAHQSAGAGRAEMAVLIGSPGLFAAACFLRRRANAQKNNVATRRRRSAHRTARLMLNTNNGTMTAGQVRAALIGYVADKCGAAGAGLTRADVMRLLSEREVSPESVRAMDELLDGLEQAEYGGGGAAVDAARARSVLDELERSALR
jgi:hypothetical protein